VAAQQVEELKRKLVTFPARPGYIRCGMREMIFSENARAGA
jgi:hypothetical protein